MGLFRNRRRNKLKQKLIAEGKLNQFRTKFKTQINQLETQLSQIKKNVQKAHEAKNDYEAKMFVYQYNETNDLKKSVLKLLTILEKAELKKDSQEIYQEFVDQLEQFKNQFKANKESPRKNRRIVRKYRKEAKSLDHQLDWIDKTITRIDRKEDRKENISDKSVNKIDVEAFLSSHE